MHLMQHPRLAISTQVLLYRIQEFHPRLRLRDLHRRLRRLLRLHRRRLRLLPHHLCFLRILRRETYTDIHIAHLAISALVRLKTMS